MEKWKLYLDDLRMPKTPGWEIARTAEIAKQMIMEKGMPYYISFDHDLGEDIDTGYDFVKWLVEYDQDHDILFKEFEFNVHSANPVGAENIRSMMDNYLTHKYGI